MTTVQLEPTLADQMVENAIQFCGLRKFQGDAQQALVALRQGRCDACALFTESLVQQVGEYLGRVDRTVKAVYKYAPDYPTGGSLNQHASPAWKGSINLIVWVERKSAALSALGTTLEAVLANSRRKIGCITSNASCYNLDIQMVDDREIQESRSFGMMINNIYVHTFPVWNRQTQTGELRTRQYSGYTQQILNTLSACNPELAPESALFDQADAILNAPADDRAALEPHLSEIKVALIRKLISDQLAYINIAKNWFTIEDLREIHRRRIGLGKVGGKAAGLLLARRILTELAEEDLRQCIATPESYFIGSDLIYIFLAMNGLLHRNDQKYKPEDLIRGEYPQIQQEFLAGELPPEVIRQLRELLERLGNKPLIVRSSSQLEDNFGTSFAGKYDSHFCPNQGTPEENLTALTTAIKRTFASTLKPEALLYRRSKGLQDYDERMAILIQEVQGRQFGNFFLPLGAGVAFSRNIYRWAPQIQREAGFARLVWGLGTRAVERVGNDYPRLVALSHPTLQPDDDPQAIRHYSQQYVDLIDLKENAFKTLPVGEVLDPAYPGLRAMCQLEEDGFFSTPRSRVMRDQLPALAITFDDLLRRSNFASHLSRLLTILEEQYRVPVDVEFTVDLRDPAAIQPQVNIHLLQCRPQSHLRKVATIISPAELEPHNIVFSTHFMVPEGYQGGIQYVVFVPPEGYFALPTQAARNELTRAISRLNARLEEKRYILVGPGRWGSTNPDLGVFVSYADIYRAAALVELAGKGIGPAPEPSLGTHFFQDLMEAQIYPVAILLDDKGTLFNRDFFYKSPNRINDFIDLDADLQSSLRVIAVADVQPAHHLELLLEDERSQALAFLAPDAA